MSLLGNEQNFDPHKADIDGEPDFPLHGDDLKVARRLELSQPRQLSKTRTVGDFELNGFHSVESIDDVIGFKARNYGPKKLGRHAIGYRNV
jgi:hypothetical protein